jgi:hypothetical protein
MDLPPPPPPVADAGLGPRGWQLSPFGAANDSTLHHVSVISPSLSAPPPPPMYEERELAASPGAFGAAAATPVPRRRPADRSPPNNGHNYSSVLLDEALERIAVHEQHNNTAASFGGGTRALNPANVWDSDSDDAPVGIDDVMSPLRPDTSVVVCVEKADAAEVAAVAATKLERRRGCWHTMRHTTLGRVALVIILALVLGAFIVVILGASGALDNTQISG